MRYTEGEVVRRCTRVLGVSLAEVPVLVMTWGNTGKWPARPTWLEAFRMLEHLYGYRDKCEGCWRSLCELAGSVLADYSSRAEEAAIHFGYYHEMSGVK